MTDRPDDYESGLATCLQQHRRLSSLDSNHDLLKYVEVSLGGANFSYNETFFDEAVRRFAQEGRMPKNAFAQAFMFARYSAALKEAADKLEGAQR